MNLEFVSANPTGPLHAGGGRWVAVGDAIANLLAAQGAEVHREYYLNDAGNQLDTFGASLLARARGEEPPEGGYLGNYVIEMAERMKVELGDDVTLEAAREWGYHEAVRELRDDLGRIGVFFDTWFSERLLHERDDVNDVLRMLDRGRATRSSRTARRGCAPPRSATRATASSCGATARPPISPAISRTTATRCAAASRTSSTSGAPITTAR